MKNMKSQKGYTMVEAISFLGIVAMLAVSVFVLINRMIDRYKISRVGTQIVELQKAIDYRFASAEGFGNLRATLLIDESIAPSDMVRGANQLRHTYAGAVTIRSTMNNFAYAITFEDIPQTPCVELLLQEWALGHNSHLISINANGTFFDWNPNSANRLPITLNDANELCVDGDNEIIWQFQ